MNVFILGTGRCGTMTFEKACSHMTNFTSGHETRSRMLGAGRFEYPVDHIEADNRLSWFLGRLDERYGNEAYYVHLKRNDEETAQSYARRTYKGGIIRAYYEGIVMGLGEDLRVKDMNSDILLDVSRDYCSTVNSNIELFLRDKSRRMTVQLENIQKDFAIFWRTIGAQGDLDAAIAEWDVQHNATREFESPVKKTLIQRALRRAYIMYG